MVTLHAVPLQAARLFMPAPRAKTEIYEWVEVGRSESERFQNRLSLCTGECVALVIGFLGEVLTVFGEWVGGGAIGSDCPVVAVDKPLYYAA